MSRHTFVQENKIVELFPNATDAAGRSSDVVSLKHYGKVTFVVTLTQGNAATVAITPMQCQDVALTGAKVLTNAVPIWSNLDTAATDTLVRQTDAVNYTTDAAVKNKHVIIEIDATQLDVANGYDCIYLTTGASNVGNLTGGIAILSEPRFNQATPPSAIVN